MVGGGWTKDARGNLIILPPIYLEGKDMLYSTLREALSIGLRTSLRDAVLVKFDFLVWWHDSRYICSVTGVQVIFAEFH